MEKNNEKRVTSAAITQFCHITSCVPLDKSPCLFFTHIFSWVKQEGWTGWCVNSFDLWNLWNWKCPTADLVSIGFPVANHPTLIVFRNLKLSVRFLSCSWGSSPKENSSYYSHHRVTAGCLSKGDWYAQWAINSLSYLGVWGSFWIGEPLDWWKEFHHLSYLLSVNEKGMRYIEVVLETSVPSPPWGVQ